VTGGVCTCTSPTTSVWQPALGGCVCDWNRYYYTVYQTQTTFTCSACTQTIKSKCGCPAIDSVYGVCSRNDFDPNYSTATSPWQCKSGYLWSQATFPYRCVAGIGAFSGYYSSSTNTYTACPSDDTACKYCDPAKGYLHVSGTNQCIKCSTVTGSSGTATPNKCVCNAKYYWNGKSLKCDLTPS
jgi:hypothetical protein